MESVIAMDTGGNVISLSWVLHGLYWVVGAANIRAAHKEIGSRRDLWHYILLLLALILINLNYYTKASPFTDKMDYLFPDFLLKAAVIIVVLGLIISVWARTILSSSWTASTAFYKGNKLISKGIYKYIRHPIYLGFILMVLGTAVYSATIGAVIGFFILVITLLVMLIIEEQTLCKHFPREYPAYKKHTKALIPFII
jgi:protein-S-isoprenylcysteine O-methyltransferase Ste14